MSAFLLNNIGILQGLKSTFEKKKKKKKNSLHETISIMVKSHTIMRDFSSPKICG
jgi:hypothetical protein